MKMIKRHNIHDVSSYENSFIRTALEQDVRLDGRKISDFRDVDVTLTRSEVGSTSEVIIGLTRVICSIRGNIITPYPDRATEGVIQVSVKTSVGCIASGVNDLEICRIIECCIKESDAIDMDSLCIITSEKVWSISIDINILDCKGGNVIDAALFATSAALRAFRKPEITVINNNLTIDSKSDNHLILHHSDEREPLQLALHHSPLPITYGICSMSDSKGYDNDNDNDGNNDSTSASSSSSSSRVLLLADPCQQEDAIIDGLLFFCFNNNDELCCLHKTGQVSVSSSTLLHAVKHSFNRSNYLRDLLSVALVQLDDTMSKDRDKRQQQLRQLNLGMEDAMRYQKSTIATSVSVSELIDKNNPILQFNSIHKSVAMADE